MTIATSTNKPISIAKASEIIFLVKKLPALSGK